jgi:hypothetical protein
MVETMTVSAIDKPFHPLVRKHLVASFGEPVADDGVTLLYNRMFEKRDPAIHKAARSVAGHHLHFRPGRPGDVVPLRDGRVFEVTSQGWWQIA